MTKIRIFKNLIGTCKLFISLGILRRSICVNEVKIILSNKWEKQLKYHILWSIANIILIHPASGIDNNITIIYKDVEKYVIFI